MNHLFKYFTLAAALLLCSLLARPCVAAGAGAVADDGVLTLQRAIELAQKNNPTMQGVRAQTEAAHGDVVRARSAFLPRIEAGGGIEYDFKKPGFLIKPGTVGNPTSLGIQVSDQTVPKVQVGVEQTIYDFGRSTNRYREATAGERAHLYEEQLFSQDLALAVTQVYLDVLLAREAVTTATAVEEAYQEHMRTAKKLFESGSVPRNDMLGAEVALSRAELNRSAAENQRTLVEMNFEKMIGAPADNIDRRTMSDNPKIKAAGDAKDSAKQNRIELAINEEQQKIARAQKARANSEYLPHVVAQAQAIYADDSFQLNKDQYRLMAGLRWPIFDGLAAYGAKKKAAAELAATEFGRQALLDKIDVEVERATLDLSQSRDSLDVANKNRAKTSENLRSMRERYASGDAPASDVIDAIAMWNVASLDYIQALHDINLSAARLKRAEGKEITGDDR